jgi:2'-5' RNA ligase
VQTLALLLPEPYAGRIVEARAQVAEEPELGRIHDPPFAHFTLQMADDYDWDGLGAALVEFASRHVPISIRTTGLLTVTGRSTGITLEPYRDDSLARFQAELWDVVTPFARGSVAPFYLPDRWVPHVTIKRCGPHRAAFGRAMTRLSDDTFIWSMQIDQLSVQHDPANNNLTRYQRLLVPLGGTLPVAGPKPASNATILGVIEPGEDSGKSAFWRVSIRTDDDWELDVHWSAPETVRVMAAAKAPLMYFGGARCWLDGEKVGCVMPVTPYPIAT